MPTAQLERHEFERLQIPSILDDLKIPRLVYMLIVAVKSSCSEVIEWEREG